MIHVCMSFQDCPNCSKVHNRFYFTDDILLIVCEMCASCMFFLFVLLDCRNKKVNKK